jgi:hypothetical protein
LKNSDITTKELIESFKSKEIEKGLEQIGLIEYEIEKIKSIG